MAYPLHQLIQKAKEFAHDAHDSILQKRKYTGLPYWVHTDEVADIVATVTDDPEVIAAAHLHDVVEDVNHFPYDLVTIIKLFGARVGAIVHDLTDEYTKENYPEYNRAFRKQMEAARLSKVGYDSQTIKYGDFISNSADIIKNDPAFAKTYLQEKKAILSVMDKGHPVLFGRASASVHV
jgi:(p)ppGpp synthase/HD superfamily hydrolase